MTNDEAMGRALALAQQAAAEGDVPVGAVVLDAEGRVIGEGRNRREDNGDPLAHAEVLAMRHDAESWRLPMRPAHVRTRMRPVRGRTRFAWAWPMPVGHGIWPTARWS